MLYHIENLVKKREGAAYTLRIPHLSIAQGEMVALTGESGCGKSTTLDVLGLVLSCDSCERFTFSLGDKVYDIRALLNSGRMDILTELRLKSLGYVLQTGELIPYLSVLENMLLQAEMRGLIWEQALEKAHFLAEKLGITRRLQAMPATLSVGERQRVAIIRALVAEPSVILADEPTAALDPLNAARVMEIFLSSVQAQGSTLILVTHNAELIRGSNVRTLGFVLEEEDNGMCAVLEG